MSWKKDLIPAGLTPELARYQFPRTATCARFLHNVRLLAPDEDPQGHIIFKSSRVCTTKGG
jgi:hypothetical protein